jgi:hypothetical protein
MIFSSIFLTKSRLEITSVACNLSLRNHLMRESPNELQRDNSYRRQYRNFLFARTADGDKHRDRNHSGPQCGEVLRLNGRAQRRSDS